MQSIDTLRGRFERLLKDKEPWIFKAICDREYLTGALETWSRDHPTVRLYVLDGNQMSTFDEFYKHFKERLSLPDYLGRNLNALSECLTDVDILKGAGFVLLVERGNRMLSKEPAEMLDGVLETLTRVGAEWAAGLQGGHPWDRPPSPFHSIFQLEHELTRLRTLPDLLP